MKLLFPFLFITGCTSIYPYSDKNFVYEDSIFEGTRKSIVVAREGSDRDVLPVITELHIHNICKASNAVPKIVLDKKIPKIEEQEGRRLVRYTCAQNNITEQKAFYNDLISAECGSDHPEIKRLCLVAKSQ